MEVEVNTENLAGSITSLIHTSYVGGSGGRIDPSDDLKSCGARQNQSAFAQQD
jgi:hypothetical protein